LTPSANWLQRLHTDEYDERKFLPSACEVDDWSPDDVRDSSPASPAAPVDWNNNYADDDDKCVLFHCGNWAKSFLPDIKISTAPILGSILGVENTYGALDGRTPAGPLTYGRITTADAEGKIRCYVGEGELTNDKPRPLATARRSEVPKLQKLIQHVCRNACTMVMTQRTPRDSRRSVRKLSRLGGVSA
jgi:hypothetical protein